MTLCRSDFIHSSPFLSHRINYEKNRRLATNLARKATDWTMKTFNTRLGISIRFTLTILRHARTGLRLQRLIKQLYKRRSRVARHPSAQSYKPHVQSTKELTKVHLLTRRRLLEVRLSPTLLMEKQCKASSRHPGWVNTKPDANKLRSDWFDVTEGVMQGRELKDSTD